MSANTTPQDQQVATAATITFPTYSPRSTPMNSARASGKSAHLRRLREARRVLGPLYPLTPRDVLHYVFAPTWTHVDPVDLSLTTGMAATAMALPGGHSVMVTATPGPDLRTVWSIVAAATGGPVCAHSGPKSHDVAAWLIEWADLNGIPHRD